jgi:hypothetical protein
MGIDRRAATPHAADVHRQIGAADDQNVFQVTLHPGRKVVVVFSLRPDRAIENYQIRQEGSSEKPEGASTRVDLNLCRSPKDLLRQLSATLGTLSACPITRREDGYINRHDRVPFSERAYPLAFVIVP